MEVAIGTPLGVATDAAGNVYFASLNCIFKLDSSGILTQIAGNSRPAYSGDGGPATEAALNGPTGVALDGAGNLFIADNGNGRIRKVAPSGVIATVAGGGAAAPGDGGPATSAELSYPTGIAVDGAGNLFLADSANHRIRKVAPSGIITTVAGDGTPGLSGDGGPATSAQLNNPRGVAVDGAGNLWIGDFRNLRVRRVSPSGTITTVAGGGTAGPGDGGRAI